VEPAPCVGDNTKLLGKLFYYSDWLRLFYLIVAADAESNEDM
jgi:hypothetical protein